MSTEAYLMPAALLFTVGVLGFLLRRNVIIAFMDVELMLSATNPMFMTFARQHSKLDGQVASFFVMMVAAAEVVIGLAIIVAVYHACRSASIDGANLLKF